MKNVRVWFQDLPIRRKLLTLFMALGFMTVLAVSIPMGVYDYLSAKRAMVVDLSTLADVLAQNSSAALTFHDREAAKDALRALHAEPNVTLAGIYNRNGEPFAIYTRDGDPSITLPQLPPAPTIAFRHNRLNAIRKIELAGEAVGTLYIESDLGKLYSRLVGYNITFFVSLLLTMALAYLAANRFQRPISGPLLDLVRTATAISEADNYSIRAQLASRDEFGLLVSAFNGMLEQIEKRDSALREYHEHLEEQVVTRTMDLSRANLQLTLQAAALENAANSIVITDRGGTIVWTNPAFSAETGYSAQEVLGKKPRILKSGVHEAGYYDRIWQTITVGKIWRGEITNRRKDGSLYVEEMSITPVRSEQGEIKHFVAIKQNITARKQAEEALRQAEEKYRGMFEDAVVGIYRTTPDGKVYSANRALAQMCGYPSPEEMIATIHDLARDLYHNPATRGEFKDLLAKHGVVRNFEHQIRRKDGSIVWLLQNARVLKNGDGEIVFYEGTVHDITERKVLEDQLRQSQKMEAVGRLAGGVAHDFNNALGVIMGYGELLDLQLAADDPMHKHTQEIIKAGQRAASLTRQLLAFSRKQVIQPVVLDLNSVVTDTEKMLHRLIGEDIDLTIVRESKLRNVKADRGQIVQILMNLAVNARDAMPKGGKLTIETANAQLTDADVRHFPFLTTGSFVLLRVTDTGCGMDSNTVAHIFEPFFTTKAEGVGTGLGLSTVYGIVKQSSGHIVVESEPDMGTTFRIYLPQVASVPKTGVDESVQPLPRGTETVLVVEDEDPLREFARGCLETNGYKVLQARNGKNAVDLATEYAGNIDLLLTDVVMPGINGHELASILGQSRTNMKVLYMSGYTHDRLSQHEVLEPGVTLISKPFTIKSLLIAVRNLLDGKPSAVSELN